MFEFFETGVCPGRIILSDDPLRIKMLAAHHLENAVLLYEQGDRLLYTGHYKGAEVALFSAGFGCGAVLEFAQKAKKLGLEELIYIGACTAVTDRYPLRAVILADSGSQGLLNRALTAAARYAIPAYVRTVLPPESAPGENIDITDSVAGSLYEQAGIDGVKALSILTVSENTKTGEKMEEHELRSRFYAAARLVFETMALVTDN